MGRLKCAAPIVLLALISSTAAAEVRSVPDPYPTIQAGILAAVNGDTVLVSAGTYQENINFRGKLIHVASHFILGGNGAFIAATTIDGSAAVGSDTTSCVVFASGEDGSAVLEGFTLSGGGGTNWVDPAWPAYTWRAGGGIFCFNTSPTIRHNIISGNAVINDGSVDGAQGGGITCFGGDPLIQNNVVTQNYADYGGGIVIDYSGGRVLNNLIVRNTSETSYGGGGFWILGNDAGAPILIENNTIVRNTSGARGGALYLWSTVVTVRNNIVWENTQASGGPVWLAGGATALMTYTNIEGGYTGEGNMDQPPAFADTMSYVLDLASPCIDAGDPDANYNDPEDPASPGEALWPARGGLRNDMGVYGGPGSQGISCYPASADESLRGAGLPSGALEWISPNPLRDSTTLRLRVAQMAPVELRIFDPTGRLVRTLLDREYPAGTHDVTWDGRNDHGVRVPGGVYLCRLVVNQGIATKRVALLR